MSKQDTMMASQASANSLDSLEPMINMVMIQTGQIFTEPDKHAPKNIIHTTRLINNTVNEAQKHIIATLDKAEMELVHAKAVLAKELEALRAKRLRAAGNAGDTKDLDGDFTMIDHADAAQDAKPKIKQEPLKSPPSTVTNQLSVPAVPESATVLAELTTSPANMASGDSGEFNFDLSTFPDSNMASDGLDFENEFLNLDFAQPDSGGDGTNTADGADGADNDLFNALNSFPGSGGNGGFDLLQDVPTLDSTSQSQQAEGNTAADTTFDDLMFNFGDGGLNLGGDSMTLDFDKELDGSKSGNIDDDDLFGDLS